ncbi:SDR family oxidoreductase [Nonomuraea sp. ATR24]|uniref:SDR family oxidoreductase n=1 Tax=unclassified Nonomuraea TaxID=2593643 RepID=UPI00340B961B
MIVVTGATGNIGRTLVRLLVEAGEQVTAVSRHITPADLPQPVGGGASPARAVAADLADPDSLRPALESADALFLLLTGALAATGDTVRHAVHAAKAAGVRRIVLVSSQSAGTRPDSGGHGRRALEDENQVRESGLEWTILRPGNFATNTLAWAESVRNGRTVFAPFGDVGLPAVDPDDIAAVAAAALREPGHHGRTYVLTGPEPITPRQMAAAIGEALGERVTYQELTREQARERMLTFMPAPIVEGTLNILGEPTADERRVSPDVAQVLGRTPGTYAAWAHRNAPAFR